MQPGQATNPGLFLGSRFWGKGVFSEQELLPVRELRLGVGHRKEQEVAGHAEAVVRCPGSVIDLNELQLPPEAARQDHGHCDAV
jgi:hypothetical protein